MDDMSQEKQEKLNLMRFWLFGTFVIVVAATLAFIFIAVAPLATNIGQIIGAGLPIWGITLVICVAAYFGYSAYLKNQ